RHEHRSARAPRSWHRRFVPGGGLVSSISTAVDRSKLPPLKPVPRFAFPALEKSTLANGLKVWTSHHAQVPMVGMLVVMRNGSAADPADREGLAAMTADMLDEGTGSLSAIEVSEKLARLGVQLDVDVGSDATLLGLTSLNRISDRAVQLLANNIICSSHGTTDVVSPRW